MIEVEDDGMGFMLERLDQPMSSGIGLANVRERLRRDLRGQLPAELTSEPGRGTSARIESARVDCRAADHGMSRDEPTRAPAPRSEHP